MKSGGRCAHWVGKGGGSGVAAAGVVDGFHGASQAQFIDKVVGVPLVCCTLIDKVDNALVVTSWSWRTRRWQTSLTRR